MTWVEKPHRHKYVNGRQIHYARYIMQGYLGRELTPDEEVHHRDGNKLNDDISNLEVLSKYDHRILHLTKRVDRFGNNKITNPNPDLAWCGRCKKFLPKDNFHEYFGRWNGVQKYCKPCRRIIRQEAYKLKKKGGDL